MRVTLGAAKHDILIIPSDSILIFITLEGKELATVYLHTEEDLKNYCFSVRTYRRGRYRRERVR